MWYVPGCAARPESIIDGIVKALGILEEKRTAMTSGVPYEQPVEVPKEPAGGA